MLDQEMHSKSTQHLSAFLIKLSSTRKIAEMWKKGQLGSVPLTHLLWVASNLQYFWRGKRKEKKKGVVKEIWGKQWLSSQKLHKRKLEPHP